MKKTRILASVLALAMCFSAMPMSAFALEEATPGANEVDVSLTIGETWTVKIPKTLVLAADTKSVGYEVQVSGNIAGTKQVKVAPDASFLMSQDGKDDITATITQEKQVVASAEIEDGTVVTLDGSISAPSATSGTWNGSFNFNIALENGPKLISFTITPHPSIASNDIAKDASGEYQAVEGMTWTEWVNSDYSNGKFKVYGNAIALAQQEGLQIDQATYDSVISNSEYTIFVD